jgi:hypothetical protein
MGNKMRTIAVMVYSIFIVSLVSRISAIKIYEIIIKPVAMYGCETWSSTKNIELRVC